MNGINVIIFFWNPCLSMISEMITPKESDPELYI